jgi:hypothetical protein
MPVSSTATQIPLPVYDEVVAPIASSPQVDAAFVAGTPPRRLGSISRNGMAGAASVRGRASVLAYWDGVNSRASNLILAAVRDLSENEPPVRGLDESGNSTTKYVRVLAMSDSPHVNELDGRGETPPRHRVRGPGRRLCRY